MLLARDGGYEAVQMRDVAARADVALGTIYRYYSSKDHLLAEINLHWMQGVAGVVAERDWSGVSPLERLITVLHMATASVEREDRLGEVFVRTAASGDEQAVR